MSRKREPEAVPLEEGVLVKHTHDVDLAERLARQWYVDDGWLPLEVQDMRIGKPRLVWIRIVHCLPNSYGASEGWSWSYIYGERGTRGVFPAVEFLP